MLRTCLGFKNFIHMEFLLQLEKMFILCIIYYIKCRLSIANTCIRILITKQSIVVKYVVSFFNHYYCKRCPTWNPLQSSQKLRMPESFPPEDLNKDTYKKDQIRFWNLWSVFFYVNRQWEKMKRNANLMKFSTKNCLRKFSKFLNHIHFLFCLFKGYLLHVCQSIFA